MTTLVLTRPNFRVAARRKNVLRLFVFAASASAAVLAFVLVRPFAARGR